LPIEAAEFDGSCGQTSGVLTRHNRYQRPLLKARSICSCRLPANRCTQANPEKRQQLRQLAQVPQ
jgi:hypothetical protein